MASAMASPDDLTKLPSLDPASIEKALKARFDAGKIYTKVNSLLVAVNPYKTIDGIYTAETLRAYTQYAKLPPQPHVYSVAADAYRGLLESHSQTLIISGESGAGKTETSKVVLQFLAHAATSSSSSTSASGLEGRIVASTPVLEAFGNAKTLLNDNSSRYGKFLMLQFNHSGKIQGATISTYLLEKSRVVSHAPGERNYHAFYCLCASPLAAGFGLGGADGYALCGAGAALPSDGALFDGTDAALESVGFSPVERESTWRLLAAALLLGNVSFGDAPEADAAVGTAGAMAAIARLLQADESELSFSLTKRNIRAGREFIESPCTAEQAGFLREGMAKAIYSKLFDWAVGRVNASLDLSGASSRSAFFIGILDIFGFEQFELNSLEQLCINYTNEKLQARFNNAVFASAAEENAVEGVAIDDADLADFDNSEVVTLIEHHTTGVLALINEECIVPKGTDASLHEKLAKQHNGCSRFKKVIKAKDRFAIVHYAGAVQYSSAGMLGKNKDSVSEDMLVLMQASEDPFMRSVFADAPETIAAAARKRGAKFQGVVAKFGRQLGELMDVLDSSDMHFIRCVKPNMHKAAGEWQSEALMRQLRSSGVLEVVRVFGMGYPDRVPHSEIVSRFGCIPAKQDRPDAALAERAGAEVTLRALLSQKDFAIGATKSFLKSGVLAGLRLRREELVATKASYIQARLRGMFSRSKWREAAQQLLDRKAMEEAEKRRLAEEAERAREEEEALSLLEAADAEKGRAALAAEKAEAEAELARRLAEESAYEAAFAKAQEEAVVASVAAAVSPPAAPAAAAAAAAAKSAGGALAPPGTNAHADAIGPLLSARARGERPPLSARVHEQFAASMPKDVLEYALYLGMDPTVDQDLLWIAEEALKTPDPPGWVEMLDPRGLLYFFNETTGESSRQHPLAEHYQQLYFKMKLEKASDGAPANGQKNEGGGAHVGGGHLLTPAKVQASFARQNTFSINLGPHITSMSKALSLATPRSSKLVAERFGITTPGADVRALLVGPARWDGTSAALHEATVSKETAGLFTRHTMYLLLSEAYRAFAFSATRHSTSRLTEYAISLDQIADEKGSAFAGRMRTNQQAREWILYDNNDDAYGLKTGTPRTELGLIVYKKKVLGPIQVEVAVPKVAADGISYVKLAPRTPEETMLQQYKAGRLDGMSVLKCSIVVQPGAGAVELVADEPAALAGQTVFRALKNVDGTWSLSYAHPLSAMHAFCFLLTIVVNPLTMVLDVPPRAGRGTWTAGGKQPLPAEIAASIGQGLPNVINSATLGWLSDARLAVYSLAVVDNVVFSGLFCGDIRVWHTDRYKSLVDAESKPEYDTLRGHRAAVTALLVDDGRLISCAEDKLVVVWDLTTLKPRATLSGHVLGVRCLALSGSALVSAGHDRSIKVWDTKSMSLTKSIDEAHRDWIRGVKVYKGSVCATGSKDKTVKLWDFRSWEVMGTLKATSDVHAIEVADGLVYAACADAKIRSWNMLTLQKAHILIGHTGTVRGLHLEPSTQTLYSAGEDKKVKLWDLKTLTCATLFGHSRFIRAVAYNSTTKKLYSGGDDARVKMWEATSA